MKKVLVIGSGGREHAIVESLTRSSQVSKIYCAPGNAGIAEIAECIQIADTDCDSLLDFAVENKIDLTIVGPEAALVTGIVNIFHAHNLPIFGHTKEATRIESSKEFAKDIMSKYNVPTAAYKSFSNYNDALDYVKGGAFPTVLKYDGLAAGKGVVIAQNLEEADETLKNMLVGESFGKGKVVIEEFLTGPEFSFMAFVNGTDVYPMPLAQDHKRAFDGDAGPNTGGMGAYTPLPFISNEEYDWALQNILQPIAEGMNNEGFPLTGVLYGGLMKTPQGIRVIEFNARFGDPETEIILPLLRSDAYDVFFSIACGLPLKPLQWEKKATIGVVLASKGYPGKYTKGFEITNTKLFSGHIFHMGTIVRDNHLYTNGGRVMMCVMSGDSISEVHNKLYQEISNIKCENLFYRKDIAHWALETSTK